MNQIDIGEAVKQAEKIAMGVHESLREAAFKSAFDALTQADTVPTARATQKRGGSKNVQRKSERVFGANDEVAQLMQLDRTEHQEIMEATSVLDRSLHVLQIAGDEFEIDGLKPSQIAKVLTEKFRCRTSRQAVQQALDSAGDKVDWVPRSGGAIFRIMAKGETYLRQPGANRDPQTPPTKIPKKSVSKRKATKPAKEPTSARSPEKQKSRRSGKPGPRQALVDLVATGFLETPRTISGIQQQIRETRGHTYKATDLSPTLVRLLRDSILTRTKNPEGQYEYKGSKSA